MIRSHEAGSLRAADAGVQVQLAGQSAPSTVGTVQLANFVNPAGLQPNGDNLLLASAASGTAASIR